MNEFSGFPKNLAYSVKQLNSFSKSTVKLTPDKWNNVGASETIRVKLPPNALVDLRTLSMYFNGTAQASAGSVHFPRLSSSLIEQMSIYVNGTMIENIQNYNVLYNTIFDMHCSSLDQHSKRSLENIDPSIHYKFGADDIVEASDATQAATNSDTNRKMMINHWLGFISSTTTPVIDTNDLSDVYLEIRFASPHILWAGSASATAPITYSLSDIRFTISKIVFNSPDYYNMKASKLLGDGLLIGYQTYTGNKSSEVNKASSLSYTINMNSTSLDQIIATFHDKDYNTLNPLQLSGSTVDAAATHYTKILTDFPAETFNNSIYFKRNAIGLTQSSFEINNVMMNSYGLPPEEVFNETLISLGNENLDFASGISAGCLSLTHFMKYYFVHVLSLENISQNDSFYKSGLDGRAASMTINWKTSFVSNLQDKCTPILFCKTTRLLQINEAHQITVIV